MENNALKAVQVIRHHGDPTHATTLLGQKVERKKSLFIKEMGGEVPCAPYDNHFIYATDEKIVGIPSFMCTCGGPAIVINHGSVTQRMLVCMIHAQSGRHSMSS
jgi:hypothetical protein